MKHDAKWLTEYIANDDFSPRCEDLAIDMAKAYGKHLSRWRAMDELPDYGERIEVAYSVGGKPDSTYICDFNDTFDPFVYAWRPAGELPEVSDEAR